MARVYGTPTQAGARGGVRSGIKVVGLTEALAKIKLIDMTARLALGQLVSAAAIHTEAAAKDRVHVISGNLKSGIKTTKGVGPYNYEVTASSLAGDDPEKNDKEYAGYEEFGWSGLPGGHPFMRPAFEETKTLAMAELKGLAARIQRL